MPGLNLCIILIFGQPSVEDHCSSGLGHVACARRFTNTKVSLNEIILLPMMLPLKGFIPSFICRAMGFLYIPMLFSPLNHVQFIPTSSDTIAVSIAKYM